MARYVWLSHIVSEKLPAYGNGPRFFRSSDRSIRSGDSCNTTTINISSHLGTHIDFPLHFFGNGKSVEAYRAGDFVYSRVSVVRIRARSGVIRYDRIRTQIRKKSDLVIICTGYGGRTTERAYWEANPGLHADIADGLRREHPSVRAVGTDSISISSWKARAEGRASHAAFLRDDGKREPLLLIEGMDMTALKKGAMLARVIVAPLRVASLDGCPATIVGEIDD